MKVEWLQSGILQLEPESAQDVFKLVDFVKSLENDDVKEAPFRAQGEQPALQGLPEYGVLLTGSPENPVIENHSGRTVIAYMLKMADQNGRGPVYPILLAFSLQPAGIPDGGAIYVPGNVPVNLAGQVQVQSPFHSTSLAGLMQRPVQTRAIGQGPIVSATLQSVVFADGQFVGVDEHGAFELFGRRIKVIAEVGLLGKAGAWDQLEALAFSPGSRLDPPADFERRSTATFLVQERKRKGDAAAAQLAEIYSSLPTPWRH